MTLCPECGLWLPGPHRGTCSQSLMRGGPGGTALRGESVDERRVKIRFSHRSRNKLAGGRFGGGWQWKVGFQSTDLSPRRGHVLLSLLVFSVSIEWGR